MTLRRKLCIAFPASLVSDIPHLREKTLRIGMIGRAAAIFGVDEIIIFTDAPKRDQHREIELITTILSYMETPQYLRKRLFKIRPELKFAGILPPLRTPHHPLTNRVKGLGDNEYREGVALSHTQDGTLIDVGVEQNALLKSEKIPLNTRLTVQIKKIKKQLEAEMANRGEIKEYWGYQAIAANATFGNLLKTRAFDLIIATSKYGRPFPEASEKLKNRWNAAKRILVAFGAPTQGLYEIAKEENLRLDDVTHFVVNTIPQQCVKTVRTEEALYVTLGALNLTIAKG